MNSAFSNTNINVQLVESLIQAIYALSPAEQILVRSLLLPPRFGNRYKTKT